VISEEKPPLFTAAAENCVETVELLINSGAVFNAQDRNGQTPIFKASLYKCAEVFSLLIDKGANVETKDKDGQTPLIMTVLGEHIDLAKTLITRGADVNSTDRHGYSSLFYYLQNFQFEFIALLLKSGFDMYARGLGDKWIETIKFDMVYKGIFEKDGEPLRVMLESGINEAEIKQWSKLLLQCAMECFDLSIVEKLLLHGFSAEYLRKEQRVKLEKLVAESADSLEIGLR